MREVSLPSGANLKLQIPPLDDALELFAAVCEEGKGIKVDPNAQADWDFMKDIAFTALASKKISACLWKCMEKSLYNDLRIDKKTFESEASRGDYLFVCVEVGKEALLPFVKNLFAQLGEVAAKIKGFLA
jgi:hypothetical protein